MNTANMLKPILEMTNEELESFRLENNIKIDDFPRMNEKYTIIAKKMKVGDSVPLDNVKQCSNLKCAMNRLGYSSGRRKLENGWRVWRIK